MIRLIFMLATLLFILAVLLPLAAFAQEPTTEVTIPWGTWVVALVEAIQPAVTLALTGIASYVVATYVPSWLQAFAGDAAQRRVNAVLQKAVSSAIAQTKAAVAGKEATIAVASEILARAMQYAIDMAPKLIGQAADDKIDNLSQMVLARMEEAGVVPEGFDLKQAREVTAPAERKKREEKFDFASAIRTGLGGGTA